MINTEMTVAELARTIPDAPRAFERFGIDYCCGGRRTLAAACNSLGVPVAEVAEALEAGREGAERPATFDDLSDLVNHIIETHHTFTRSELARIGSLSAKVAGRHAAKYPELTQVAELARELTDDLLPHLEKEERILFPYLVALASATPDAPRPRAPFASVAGPISMMEREHEQAGKILHALRSATRGYAVPPDACASFRALYTALDDLERDLFQHIHLENNVAFPWAERLEREGQPRASSTAPR